MSGYLKLGSYQNKKQTFLLLGAVLVLLIGVISPLVLARPASAFAGGDGSDGNPYAIADCTQLFSVQTNINNNAGQYAGKAYKLVASIDMSDCEGQYYHPIGGTNWGAPFTGKFDGQGYTISNLYIFADESGSQYNSGLFGYVSEASIHDVNLTGVDATVGVGNGNVGALIGYAERSDIQRVSATGAVTTFYYEAHQSAMIGGLVGGVSNSTIKDVYTNVNVSANTSATDSSYGNQLWVGGLIGGSSADEGQPGSIVNAYSRGSVTGNGARLQNTGGLIGYSGDVDITNSFSAGEVSGGSSVADAEMQLGTFIGSLTGDGVTGSAVIAQGEVNQIGSAYLNTILELDVIDDATPGVGYFQSSTHAPMNTWNFNTVWKKDTANDGYPYLRSPSDAAPVEADSDLNGDGILDTEQANVSSVTGLNNNPVVLEVDDVCEVNELLVKTEGINAIQDSGYTYPDGFVNFTVDCGTPGYTTTVKQYFYGVNGANLVARKYNPTTSAYFTINNATITTETIHGNNVTVLSYEVTDGGVLDTDGVVNGVIVDPVGLGASAVGAPNTGIQRAF